MTPEDITVNALKIRQISDSEFLKFKKMTKIDDIVKTKFLRNSKSDEFLGSGQSRHRSIQSPMVTASCDDLQHNTRLKCQK